MQRRGERGGSAERKGWRDAMTLTQPHQDPAARLNEECMTVVQPGGDRGTDKLLSSRTGQRWPQLEVVEGNVANMVY